MMNSKMERYLDDLFVVEGAMIEDNGEDSWFCALGENSAIAAVFDGSGGLGAKKYRNFSGKTGAYIGARVVSGAASDWYHRADAAGTLAQEGFRGFPDYVRRGYALAKERINERIRVAGSMTRELPTTAAAAVLTPVEEKGGNPFARGRFDCKLRVLWAGDSRVYLLDPSGLIQVTKDDLDEMDAYSNLLSDGAMNNVVAADGQTVFHQGSITLESPFLVFAATDGCFGYTRTPMEFEYLVLSAMAQAWTPEEFQRILKESIEGPAGDDFTLCLMAAGFGSFAQMKKTFASRKSLLEEKYIRPLEEMRGKDREASVELEKALWEEYRTGYERLLRDEELWESLEDIR